MEIRKEVLVVPRRTLVVEDHKAFLNYICSALRKHPDVEIVGEAQNGLEAVERAAALQPDLIFLDIGLPGVNGIEAARRIRAIAVDAKIVFVTQESSRDIVHEAFQLGASGYILKASLTQDLPTALDAIKKGKNFVSQGLDGQAR